MRTVTLFLLCTLGAPWTLAASPLKGIDLQLLSEVASIKAGEPFTVGLHIHHHEGYHTYWRNPGIVGLATDIDWTLPPGFSAGPIQWPYPEIVDMAGHPAHGFNRDVLLMVEITPPDQIAPEKVTFRAGISWMACADSCHPGTATLSLTLPVRDATALDRTNRDRFRKARRDLPKILRDWKATVSSEANAPTIQLHLARRRDLPHKLQVLYFFSSDGQVSSDQPQELKAMGNGTYILTLRRAEFGPANATTVPGVLISPSPFGPDRQLFGTIAPSYPDRKTAPPP